LSNNPFLIFFAGEYEFDYRIPDTAAPAPTEAGSRQDDDISYQPLPEIPRLGPTEQEIADELEALSFSSDWIPHDDESALYTGREDRDKGKEPASDDRESSEDLATAQTYESGTYFFAGEESRSRKDSRHDGEEHQHPCTWPSCSMTFSTRSDLDRHIKTVHLNDGARPYRCLVKGCSANVRSWTTVRGLRAHEKDWHGSYACEVAGCSRGYPHGFGSKASLEKHQEEHLFDSKSNEEYQLPLASSYTNAYGPKLDDSSYSHGFSKQYEIPSQPPTQNYDSYSYGSSKESEISSQQPIQSGLGSDLAPPQQAQMNYHSNFIGGQSAKTSFYKGDQETLDPSMSCNPM
jgi:hypothetical protein